MPKEQITVRLEPDFVVKLNKLTKVSKFLNRNGVVSLAIDRIWNECLHGKLQDFNPIDGEEKYEETYNPDHHEDPNDYVEEC